jgi:hypothetical protein
MKLLLCITCNDIFPVGRKKRLCSCKATGGKYYDDGWHACYWGKKAVPLGFANPSFVSAIRNRGYMPVTFDAFVIEKACRTFVEVENAKSPMPDSIKEHMQFCKRIGVIT